MSRGNRKCLTLLASVTVAVLFLAAAPVPSPQGISVGEFVTLVANHLQPAAGEKAATAPEAAVRILNKAGVQVKGDLASPLTAGDATDIFQQLGITLTAQHPGTLLEKDRAAALVETFGDSFKAPGTGAPASAAVSTHRGTSGAPTPTLEDLDACQNLPKVKDCHDCCKALGTFANKTCAQACSNSPKASAMEPTP